MDADHELAQSESASSRGQGRSADQTSMVVRATVSTAEAANLADRVGNVYPLMSGELAAAESKDAITRLGRVMAQREARSASLRAEAARSGGPAVRTIDPEALREAELIGAMSSIYTNVTRREEPG